MTERAMRRGIICLFLANLFLATFIITMACLIISS